MHILLCSYTCTTLDRQRTLGLVHLAPPKYWEFQQLVFLQEDCSLKLAKLSTDDRPSSVDMLEFLSKNMTLLTAE